jgi:type IV pilus assembly protein PilY1
VCGLRKGGNTYFALDITDTTDTKNPKFLWEFPKATDTVTLEKVGQSWSEPAVGRVKVEDEEGEKLVERWVAFIGGGFDKSEGVGEANVGRAFFVVDLKTGKILWEFSFSGSEEKKNRMIHSFPAPPKAADLNFDGYVDRVYLGDLGGQMWVFDVSFDEVRKKSNSQWNGKRLFRAPGEKPEKHPIYYPPAVALDPSGTPWVFWGTGDRENPTEKNSKERFYAVKDDAINDEEAKAYPYEEKDLLDVTTNNTFSQDLLKKGWFIQLAKSEKVLAKPTVFSRLVYFTTYTHTEPDPCKVSGEGRLYTVEYLSGGGAVQFSDLDYATGNTSGRSTIVGSGVPSAPVITVSTKGETSVIIATTLGEVYSEEVFSLPANNEILYWREVIP